MMVTFVLLMVPLNMKDLEEWKCVITISGVLSVMIPGVILMQQLYVGNWGMIQQVSYCSYTYIYVLTYNSSINCSFTQQEPQVSATPSLEVVVVEFFWTMLDAQAVNQHSLTALILALEFTIVTTLMMLE